MKNTFNPLGNQERIQNTQTFDELKQVLGTLPEKGVQGSGYFYSSDFLIQLIEKHEQGEEIHIRSFPRTFGLREQIKDLFQKELGGEVKNLQIIDTQDGTKEDISEVLEHDVKKQKIIELLSNSDEEGDNSELLVNIINTYGKEGINIIFEEGGLSFLEVGTEYSVELADTDFFKDFGKNIPSLELRQYFCAKIKKNYDLMIYERENEAYLVCCEQSELHQGHEALLISLLIERERSISGQLNEMSKIINSSDLNILILEIYQQRMKLVGELEKSVLERIFTESNIYTPLLNDESLSILKKLT